MLLRFLKKIQLIDFYIGKEQRIVKAKKIKPDIPGKFRNHRILTKKWVFRKITLPLIWEGEVDEDTYWFKKETVKKLLKIRKYGGYFFGHLPFIRKIIVWLEDWINNKGRPTLAWRHKLAWAIHLVTGNSIFYLDYVNGNDSNNGSTWALAWKTITNGATAARIAPGDIIRIAKSPPPTSIGNATWTNGSKTVTLATAQTANITMCESAWTAANGATVTLTSVSTDAKEGSYCMQITFPSSPTANTKYAYFATGTLNLSSYQKISFWIKNSAAIANATTLKVVLCSDTTGNTIVDTFYIPAIPSTGRWIPLTLARSGGGNLGSSIQSIAIYTDASTPTGSSYIYVDDFIACTTDGLNLQSLISKNPNEQGGTEGWYAIQSINGTTIMLDNDTNTKANAGRGYSGTTETVTTYKRETIKTALASSSTTAVQEVQKGGALGNNIQFQGGWNTSTTVQDGETFFDGLNGYGYGLYLNSKAYITLNYLNFCRYYYGVYYYYSSNNTITTLSNANNNAFCGVFYYYSSNNTITTLSNANNNASHGVYYSNSNNNTIITLSNANNNASHGVYYYNSNNNTIITLSNANNNASHGVYYSSSNNNTIITLSNANNNGNYGVYYSYSNNNIIKSLSTSNNGTAGICNNVGINYLFNALINETTEVSGYTDFANSRIFSHNHDQIANNHKIFTDGGLIQSTTSVRHTDSGIAWQLSPTSTNRSSNYPLSLVIARIAVAANSQVTVKAWFRRTDTGITGRLICKGKQIAGVDNDVYADMTAAADTWEQLQIQFTPTEAGVVEIEAQAWGGTSYSVYVDDMEISQA
jgi:hypothetical protein